MTPVAPPPVASPCNGVCSMDPASGFCRGCLRSIDEIAQWSRLDEDGKRAVLARLAPRRGAVAPPPEAPRNPSQEAA